jgi:peroxidase
MANSPRVISLSVIRDIDAPSDTDTTWIMQFAQFVDHGKPTQNKS